jgi:hypothetical protein
MTTSDIVTAKPFAKPFTPSLRPKPNAISATATATAIRGTIEDIFFTVLILPLPTINDFAPKAEVSRADAPLAQEVSRARRFSF